MEPRGEGRQRNSEREEIKREAIALKFLAPRKMWEISCIMTEREALPSALQLDDQLPNLTGRRGELINKYIGTEARIINTVTSEVTKPNKIAGSLWADLLLKIAAVSPQRSVSLYYTLQEAKRDDNSPTKRLDRVLAGLREMEPTIDEKWKDRRITPDAPNIDYTVTNADPFQDIF